MPDIGVQHPPGRKHTRRERDDHFPDAEFVREGGPVKRARTAKCNKRKIAGIDALCAW